jgi:hypothetical protein
MDTAATTWAAAHDACVVRGGHLPRAAELAELIQQGLPNGSNAKLWTSDQAGFDGNSEFYAIVLNWTGTAQRFSFQNGSTEGALGKHGSAAYRCIYYPIDKTYVAPTTCTGGCFMVTANGTPAPTMWLDSTDRAAANVSDAMLDCSSSGAHLASERDLTEAIRAGLPNGSGGNNTFIYTSDFAQGPMSTIVKWSGTDTAFTDQYSTYMSWSVPTTARPYRCMWTNEQR